jgi:dienelactone hydrolase
LADIYGITSNDGKLLGDSMATAGYMVVMPDIMANDIPTSKSSFNYSSWFPKHPVSVADHIIDMTVKHVRSEMGIKKIGAVGYCFGGRYAVRVLKLGGGLMLHSLHTRLCLRVQSWRLFLDRCGSRYGPLCLCHSSDVVLRCSLADIWCCCVETDAQFNVTKRREAEDILVKKIVPYQMTLYSDTQHGFSVRANLQDKNEKLGNEGALLQAIRWFDD